MTTILVVDDNGQNQYMLEALLGGSGYEVITATDGAQALAMARDRPPSVVISDILMPIMDGFTLCRHWKTDDRLQQIPFIFYTATYTDANDEAFARDLGADRFLRKPAEPDAFLAVVREVIAQGPTGHPAAASPAEVTEEVHLRQYNQVLLRKLEDKMEELERANQSLEQRVAERTAELEERNQTLEAFAYSMAHDLGAPLRGIRGFAGILQDEESSALSDAGRENLQIIIASSDQLDGMMQDLLRYATMGSGGLGKGPVPLGNILSRVRRDLTTLMKESGATIDIPAVLPTVTGEATLLTQIFLNLIRNALTYHRPGERPQVVVACREAGDRVIMSVSDQGIGIRPQDCEQIFSLFRRLNSQEAYPGSGVGLGIVERAVRLLGGRVWVESEFGQGSTFSVELPLGETGR